PGQHVVHARALQHCAHRAAGDDAGTGAGGLEQHHAGRGLTLHRVRDRAADARDAEEVLLGRLDALGDGRGPLRGLPVPHTVHPPTAPASRRSPPHPPPGGRTRRGAPPAPPAPPVLGSLPPRSPGARCRPPPRRSPGPPRRSPPPPLRGAAITIPF